MEADRSVVSYSRTDAMTFGKIGVVDFECVLLVRLWPDWSRASSGAYDVLSA